MNVKVEGGADAVSQDAELWEEGVLHLQIKEVDLETLGTVRLLLAQRRMMRRLSHSFLRTPLFPGLSPLGP